MSNEYKLPPYDNAGVQKGYLIDISTFLQTVHNIGEAYLNHECQADQLNRYSGALPGGASPGFGANVWKISVAQLRTELESLRAAFKSKNFQCTIEAEATWSFLTSYFYKLCRLHEYRFSYLTDVTAKEKITLSYFGLGELYFQTEQQYRAEAERRGIQSYAKIEINQLIIAGGAEAVDDGVVDACEALCKLNADMEMCHDYGMRNSVSLVTQTAEISRLWAAAATDVYFWWTTLGGLAQNIVGAGTPYTITTQVEGWFGGVTVHVAYVSWSKEVLLPIQSSRVDRLVHNDRTAVLDVRITDVGEDQTNSGEPSRRGTVSLEPGAHQYNITIPPTSVTVVAYPNSNCRFLCWNGDPALSSTSLNLQMNQDQTADAWMLSGNYLLTLNTVVVGENKNASGVATAAGWSGQVVSFGGESRGSAYSFTSGDHLSVTLYPSEYTSFAGWYLNNTTEVSQLSCYEIPSRYYTSNLNLTARLSCTYPGLVLNLVSTRSGESYPEIVRSTSRDPNTQYSIRVSRSEFTKEDGSTEVAGYAKILDVGPTGTVTMLVEKTNSGDASWVSQVVAAIEESGHTLSAVVGGAGGRAEIWTTDFPVV